MQNFPELDTPPPNAGVAARQRMMEEGDHAAAGGRGKSREDAERAAATATLLTDTQLREAAQKEIQAQLRHKDPKIRRDAAKAALELVDGKYAGDKDARAVIYLTAALDDAPETVEELERLAAEAEQAARARFGVPSGV